MTVQFSTAALTKHAAPELDGLRRALHTESLSPKRLLSNRGLDAWYPYYAGFSTAFARRVLECLNLPTRSRVLDPWNGSGTTTCAAYELGLSAIGIDLNPVASVIAAGKLAAIVLDEDVLGRAIDALAERFRGRSTAHHSDALSVWLEPQSAGLMSRLVEQAKLVGEGTAVRSRRLKVETGFSPVSSFLLLCLLRSGRQLAIKRCWSNPTWVKVREPASVKASEWREAFVHTARAFLREASSRKTGVAGHARLMTADARDMASLEGGADVILTSPPYCTRIDYAMTTGFELAALGLGAEMDFRALRENLMGTPVIRGNPGDIAASVFSSGVENTLRRVSEHPSWASNGYYRRNLQQYFLDAQAAVAGMSKVLRPGGVGIVIVQNSYYKEIEIDLPELYADMARHVGFSEASVLFHVPVRSFFAGINGRAARHLAERTYRESVVAMSK
ncbi:MAG: DNA methyltransferase [Deltaproteobacteria bacterium]|nr:DNA methyltransferase [Myxococcales bacterium]MDP3214043.1 DNA methyltransferase [Deltaproteobacteria bacterium]